MARTTRGRGWHGNPEGHAEAARARDRFNWWPLLLVPLAFLIGIFSSSLTNIGQGQEQPQILRGVGGGPGTTCITPTMTIYH